jgi:hypothetical protein
VFVSRLAGNPHDVTWAAALPELGGIVRRLFKTLYKIEWPQNDKLRRGVNIYMSER